MSEILTFKLPFDVRACHFLPEIERSAMLRGLSEKIGSACCDRLLEIDTEEYGIVKDATEKEGAVAVKLRSSSLMDRILRGETTWWGDEKVMKGINVYCELGCPKLAASEELYLSNGYTVREIGGAVLDGLRGIAFNKESEIAFLNIKKIWCPEKEGSSIWIEISEVDEGEVVNENWMDL